MVTAQQGRADHEGMLFVLPTERRTILVSSELGMYPGAGSWIASSLSPGQRGPLPTEPRPAQWVACLMSVRRPANLPLQLESVRLRQAGDSEVPFAGRSRLHTYILEPHPAGPRGMEMPRGSRGCSTVCGRGGTECGPCCMGWSSALRGVGSVRE